MILVVLAIVLSAVTCFGIFVYYSKIAVKFQYNKTKKVGIKPFLGLLWLLLILLGIFTAIEKNTVGIVYDEINGGIQEETLGEGLHIKSPFQKIYKIGTSNKIQTIQMVGQTKDSIYADMTITIVYRIEADNAGKFFKVTNANDIDSKHLNSIVQETLQSVSIKYDIYGILGTDFENLRVDFTMKLEEKLKERYFITLVSTSIDDVDAGERIEEIIRTKGEALQQKEIEMINKEKAEIQKEILMIEAEAKAEVVRIAAEAQADKIEFEKRALANMIMEYIEAFPTLTEKEVAQIVLQTVFYETWDGKLPEVVTGDSLEAIIGGLLTH